MRCSAAATALVEPVELLDELADDHEVAARPDGPVSASSTAGRTIASSTEARSSSGVRPGLGEQLALARGEERRVLLEHGDEQALAGAEVVVDRAAVALPGPAGDLDQRRA